MEQQASNVWRKRAFSAMKAAHDQFGKDAAGSDRLLACLDTFRERVDHNVENTVPVGLVSHSCVVPFFVRARTSRGKKLVRPSLAASFVSRMFHFGIFIRVFVL